MTIRHLTAAQFLSLARSPQATAAAVPPCFYPRGKLPELPFISYPRTMRMRIAELEAFPGVVFVVHDGKRERGPGMLAVETGENFLK